MIIRETACITNMRISSPVNTQISFELLRRPFFRFDRQNFQYGKSASAKSFGKQLTFTSDGSDIRAHFISDRAFLKVVAGIDECRRDFDDYLCLLLWQSFYKSNCAEEIGCFGGDDLFEIDVINCQSRGAAGINADDEVFVHKKIRISKSQEFRR